MGKGLWLSIHNDTASAVDVSYSNFNCVYQNGDEGSDFRPIQGSLAPGQNFNKQYIEAKASGGCFFKVSTFNMSLKVGTVVLAVKFSESSNAWSVNGESFAAGDSLVDISMRSGDQDECIVTVSKVLSLNSSNWMSGLDDRQRFFDVLIPGTHDSGTYAYSSGDINNPLNRFVQCQDSRSNFLAQLQNGIRFLDLRVRKVGSALGRNLSLFHGDEPRSFYLHAGLGDALQAVEQFLRENPTETVVISIKREEGPCEHATSDIGPEDIQGYIDKYNNIKWIAGHIDFGRIKERRQSNGLGDLNGNEHFQLETENPRRRGSVLGLSKLNYDHLAVGDVRGCAILMLRSMPSYDQWHTNIAALDYGRFTNGVYTQDNYAGPEYKEKKEDIVTAAKGERGNDDDSLEKAKRPRQPEQFSINFLSAASTAVNPASSPVSFALTINAGLASNNYETDDSTLTTDRSPSLKSLLRPDGELHVWNLQRRQEGKTGLRGVMVGDFMLCPQSWYNEFWSNGYGKITYSRRAFVPNPNSTDYGIDDHLVRLIWSQNQLSNPKRL